MIHVAIISPYRSLETINQAIQEHDFGCRFHKYTYYELSDIDGIYAVCKNTCDVIFFSGELGYHYIHRRFPDIRIPCAFTAYGSKDILSILLNFVIDHPDIPLNRVFVDFLTPMNQFMDIHRYVSPAHMPYVYDDSPYDYAHITALTRRLWDEGRIDMVISRSINNLPTLDALNIPYIAVFPSTEMVRESITSALDQLRLSRSDPTEYLTIIIRLTFGENCSPNDREYQMATLHKLLVDYRRSSGQNFTIYQAVDRFITTQRISPDPDLELSLRQIIQTIRSETDLFFHLGAGLHPCEDVSLYQAEQALLAAIRQSHKEGFLMAGQDGTLIGPLASGSAAFSRPTTSQKISTFARHSGISEHNLFGVVGLFQSSPDIILTTSLLSEVLGVTTRSASRILKKLTVLGLTTSLENEQPGGKGRPMHRYRFVSQNFLDELL